MLFHFSASNNVLAADCTSFEGVRWYMQLKCHTRVHTRVKNTIEQQIYYYYILFYFFASSFVSLVYFNKIDETPFNVDGGSDLVFMSTISLFFLVLELGFYVRRFEFI